jgi:hypothetical protein
MSLFIYVAVTKAVLGDGAIEKKGTEPFSEKRGKSLYWASNTILFET